MIDKEVFSVMEFTPKSDDKVDCLITLNGITDTIEMQFDGNNTSLLPNHLFIDTHPLCQHKTAIYAGLLGKQTMWLYKLTPANNSVNETTTYTYEVDENGWPKLCKEKIEAPGNYENTRYLNYTISCYLK